MRVGGVGAVGARADGAVEVVAERGRGLAEAADGLAHGLGDGGPGPFGGGSGVPVAAAESDGPGEFVDQEVAFELGLLPPGDVVVGAGVLDVLLDLGEPPPVHLLGAVVQEGTGVTGAGEPHGRRRGPRCRRR